MTMSGEIGEDTGESGPDDTEKTATPIESKYFELQNKAIKHEDVRYDVDTILQHEPLTDLLSSLNPTYIQHSMLTFKDSDEDLVKQLEPLQRNIETGLKGEGFPGKIIAIGSSKSQMKVQSLNELDLACLLDQDGYYTSRTTSDSHVYRVQTNQTFIDARDFREKFGTAVANVLSNLTLPPRLAHSGYRSPKFSGIRYSGPATAMLFTWDPEGEAREISVDITPMLHLPPEDDINLKNHVTQKYHRIREEMPKEIFRFDGTYLMANPISNRWEPTTSSYEATNLLPHIARDTPFKNCILLCKSIANELSSLPIQQVMQESEASDEMKTIFNLLEETKQQSQHIREEMKYGHAFLQPDFGMTKKEMTKKAITINTAALTHTALHIASGMHGAFMSTHDPDEHRRLTLQLATGIFWYLSSVNHHVHHFFLDSQIRLLSVATWARQIYDTKQLVDNMKTRCLLTAHLLAHGCLAQSHEEDLEQVNQQIEIIPARKLEYAMDAFQVPVQFSGKGCNNTFGIILKLANALGNTMGGIIHICGEKTADIDSRETWKATFKAECVACGMLHKIIILDEEGSSSMIVMHVPRFPKKISLPSYILKVNTPHTGVNHAKDESSEIERTVLNLRQQSNTRLKVYCLSEDRKITTSESKENTHVEKATSEETTNNSFQENEEVFVKDTVQRQDGIADMPAPGMYRYDSRTSNLVVIDSESTPQVNKILENRKKLGWTTNKKDWGKNLRQASIDIDSCVEDMAQSDNTILKLANPVAFIPSKESILHRHPRLRQALQCIEKRMADRDALAIVCESWPKQADIGNTPTAPEHHYMDVIAFDRLGSVEVWCLVIRLKVLNESQSWEYVMEVGRATKKACIANNFGKDVHIQCHVYSLSDNKICKSSKLIPDTNLPDVNVVHMVARLLIGKKSYHRNCLGEDMGIHLTASQLEVVLMSGCTQVVLVEGPPGSGKTYMAFHICSKYERPQVLYICCTLAFKEYLNFQGICTPELIKCEKDLVHITKRVKLENYKCIIIDDGHQLGCSYKAWKAFFDKVMLNSSQVYIFVDSQYQNFIDVDLSTLTQCVDELKETGDASYYPLFAIHRNSRRISSFLVSSSTDLARKPGVEKQLSCSSLNEGHDVEVLYIKNVFEESKTNELLQLIESQLLQGLGIGQDNMYDSCDIAILVDTKNAKEDIERLKKVFKRFSPDQTVHCAERYPVEGITLDTLDNFMGFDRRVCICITREHAVSRFGKIMKQTAEKRNGAHHLQNPKYRTFVASRGVSTVFFIVDIPISIEVARLMKMDLLPTEPRHLWTTSISQTVSSMGWLPVAGQASLLYTTTSGMFLVSSNQELLPLELDTGGKENPSCVHCTHDGEFVLVADGRSPYKWTTYKRVEELVYREHKTHTLDSQPKAACWTSDMDVVMLVTKQDQMCHLQRYDGNTGSRLWEVRRVLDLSPSVTLSVFHDLGHLLLSTDWAIHVYSPGGQCLRKTKLPDRVPAIHSVCAGRGQEWFTGHKDGTIRLWGADDTDRARHTLTETDGRIVCGIQLSGDGLLAVRTSDKLSVYNVEAALE